MDKSMQLMQDQLVTRDEHLKLLNMDGYEQAISMDVDTSQAAAAAASATGVDTDDDKDLVAVTSSTGEDDDKILSERGGVTHAKHGKSGRSK